MKIENLDDAINVCSPYIQEQLAYDIMVGNSICFYVPIIIICSILIIIVAAYTDWPSIVCAAVFVIFVSSMLWLEASVNLNKIKSHPKAYMMDMLIK
jgi:uncharacterized protein YsxB (DUF464 family)